MGKIEDIGNDRPGRFDNRHPQQEKIDMHDNVLSYLFTSLLFVVFSCPASAETVRIDADFPGGNIIVERIEGNTIFLRPDQRDSSTWWFYWYFRVRGAAGRTLKFQFTGKNPIGTQGPAFSTDGGGT